MVSSKFKLTGLEALGLGFAYKYIAMGVFTGGRSIAKEDSQKEETDADFKLYLSSGAYVSLNVKIFKNWGVEAKVLYENKNEEAKLDSAFIPNLTLNLYW